MNFGDPLRGKPIVSREAGLGGSGGKPCDRLHFPEASKQEMTAVKPGTGLGWEEGEAGVAAVHKRGEGE